MFANVEAMRSAYTEFNLNYKTLKCMKFLIEKLKALRLYFVSCRFSHKWEYFDNGLTRKCKRCDAIDVTVGEEPSLYRMAGDKWVRTFSGNGN